MHRFNRVLRIPGFLNRKYRPPIRSTVEYPSDPIWNPYRLPSRQFQPPCSRCAESARQIQLGKHTHSEQDWAWICTISPTARKPEADPELAARRADKPNPLYYAQRTVDMASARLWLLEGAPIDDVITMLEVRRNFELPTVLCSARAREMPPQHSA